MKKVSFVKYAQKRVVRFVFYDKYVELCKLKGVSPTAAALANGLSKATPTKWKNTGAIPSGETLSKLAKYFGVSVEQLLSEDNEIDSLKEEMRDDYATRILFATMDGAEASDLLEAAALIQRRKEERTR